MHVWIELAVGGSVHGDCTKLCGVVTDDGGFEVSLSLTLSISLYPSIDTPVSVRLLLPLI